MVEVAVALAPAHLSAYWICYPGTGVVMLCRAAAASNYKGQYNERLQTVTKPMAKRKDLICRASSSHGQGV